MLKAGGYTKLPGFNLQYFDGDNYFKDLPFPGFYFFDATWDNPAGSAYVGKYAVERETGDIWDSIVCARYTSPTLVRLQALLRKRIGLSDAEYRKLRKPGPFCDPGEEPATIEVAKARL